MNNTPDSLNLDTEKLALQIRIHVVNMTSRGESAHVGACLSIADILGVIYGNIMRLDPKSPKHPKRDRIILSKGHAGAAVYATLAECGFFPVDKLKTHYQNGSDLSGHVSHKNIPGVEFSTGSLGHGLGVLAGIALAGKRDKSSRHHFAILSDGECDEGSNWEAILFAAHHELNNLTAIIDYNKIQSLAPVAETLGLEPFTEKWSSFGWRVLECDGHNHLELKASLEKSMASQDCPTVVIAHTTKGKGISFMENTVLWHYRTPRGDELKAALKELEQQT